MGCLNQFYSRETSTLSSVAATKSKRIHTERKQKARWTAIEVDDQSVSITTNEQKSSGIAGYHNARIERIEFKIMWDLNQFHLHDTSPLILVQLQITNICSVRIMVLCIISEISQRNTYSRLSLSRIPRD